MKTHSLSLIFLSPLRYVIALKMQISAHKLWDPSTLRKGKNEREKYISHKFTGECVNKAIFIRNRGRAPFSAFAQRISSQKQKIEFPHISHKTVQKGESEREKWRNFDVHARVHESYSYQCRWNNTINFPISRDEQKLASQGTPRTRKRVVGTSFYGPECPLR